MSADITLQSKKLELIRWLAELQDSAVINEIFELKKKDKEWWNEISTAERESIKSGIKDIDEGRLIPHEEIVRYFKK